MTEPMTSVEIEDVLSSIRRLVSEDLRPAASQVDADHPVVDTSAPVAAPAMAPAETGKLLLTPALRVVTPAPEPPDAERPAPERARRQEARMTTPPPIETVVARVGAQVRDDWDDEADLEAPPVWSATPIWESEIVEVDLNRVEEAEILQFTSPDAARLEEAWRDGAWADAPVSQPMEDADFLPEAVEPAPFIEVDESGHPVAAEVIEMVEPPITEPQPLGDMAEAALREELRSIEDSVAAEVVATAPAAGIFAPQDSDDFDEEALREVVRDIIREELQGALGERITRNVRKLVRAEINRALASRDLA